jgi:lysophospholipase L1-like esterase
MRGFSVQRSVIAIIATLTLGLLSVAPATSAKAAEDLATISGRVTFNGAAPTQDFTWTVDAAYYGGDSYAGGIHWGSQVVSTSPDGSFTISGVRPGEDYTVYASGSQRITGEDKEFPRTYLGGVASVAAADTFRLQAGENRVVHLDIGEGGLVSGIVRDQNGAPISNASVGVWTAGTGDVLASTTWATDTREDGTWSLRLPLGSYRIGFTNASSSIGYNYEPLYRYTLAPGVRGLHNQWWKNRATYETSPSVRVTSTGVTGISATLTADEPSDGGIAQVDSYVALGDSFQSGEGANPRKPGQPSDNGFYHGNTDSNLNKCHRSLTAYPELLVADGFVTGDYASWACSGALIEDLRETAPSPDSAPWNDPLLLEFDGSSMSMEGRSALDRVNEANPDLITIGIGGNDMGFGPILEDCVKQTVPLFLTPCWVTQQQATQDRLDELQNSGAWHDIFAEVRDAAPNAHVVVLGYPHFYELGTEDSWCQDGLMNRPDQMWINNVVESVDKAIEEEASAMGFHYVDIYEASNGHELCQGPEDERFLNGIMFKDPRDLSTFSESYHPTPYGHRVIADIIQAELASPSVTAPEQLVLQAAEHESLRFRVPEASPEATFSVWASSQVSVELVSPGGRVISPANLGEDVEFDASGGRMTFSVTGPETGAWKIQLTAPGTASQAVQLNMRAHADQKVNLNPVAQIDVQPYNSSSFVFSAANSNDPDGYYIDDYLWDFGDGTTATGREVEHRYTTGGPHHVTLVVSDAYGALGFATLDEPVSTPSTLTYVSESAESSLLELRVTNDALEFDDKVVYPDPPAQYDELDPTISEGGQLAYVARTSSGDALHVLADWLPTTIAEMTEIEDPEWAPDGNSIAYAGSGAEGTGIYVTSSDGGSTSLIAVEPLGARSPSWSADGSQLTYARDSADGRSELVTINADGTGLSVVATDDYIGSLDWSPDGGRIAYSAGSSEENAQLHVVDLNLHSDVQITSGAGAADDPAWDRQGNRIAYTNTVGDDSNIWIVDPVTTSATVLIESDRFEGAPAWN